RVALLRGVNLAARRRVSMADLRDLVTGLGYADVATLLQSGNVVLSSDEPPTRVAERIAGAIAERLGMDVDVIVRTGRELQEVVAANPLAQHADEGKWLHVLFLSDAPDPEAVRGLEEEDVAPDAI